MKVTSKSNAPERNLVTAAIVNKGALARLSEVWQDDMLPNKWSNMIVGWCINYYRKHEEAPMRSIQPIFERWEAKTKDSGTARLVGKFLAGLSGNYNQNKKKFRNTDFITDQAGEYLNQVLLEKAVDETSIFLENGKVSKALERWNEFTPLEIGADTAIDVLNDRAAIKQAFNENVRPVILYDDDLGRFFGRHLQRDALIGVMGPEKRGKSYMLMEFGITAALQKQRVLYFDCGDMSRNQIIRRMMCRIAKAPLEPGKIKLPYSITKVKKQPPEVMWTTKTFKKDLTFKSAWKACRATISKYRMEEGAGYLQLSCHPNSSLTIGAIDAIVQSKIRQGWIPDVVIIDYADILANPMHIKDSRAQIDYNWRGMRALSQKHHCLVLTATQAKATSYMADTLDMSHFSEDKRKFAHVNGMISLNQTELERRDDVMRLGWLVLREGKPVQTNRLIYIAGCRAIGNLCMVTSF